MFTTVAMKRVAFALVVASAVAGAAEAETVPPDARRTCKCSTALVTLLPGTASFHVTLDEYGPESGVFAVMRFINQNGTVLQSKITRLFPGKSATLSYRGSGQVRVQAEIFKSVSDTTPAVEPVVMSSLELSLDGADAGRYIGPIIWVPCDVLKTL